MLDIEKIKFMYLVEKKNLTKISKETGINRKRLAKELNKVGIKTTRGIHEETLIEIIEFLNEGNSMKKACEKFGVDKTTLASTLDKAGYRKIQHSDKRDNSYDNAIINLFNENISIENIAKRLNISTNKVSKCLKVNNINNNRNFNTYSFDTNIFDVIDTEEKAYWLGFLYADGYVSLEKGIELTLSEKDLKHLEKFKSFMKSNHKIQQREDIKAYRLCIYSKDLAQRLTSLGCFQNKSLILKFPTKKQVPKHLIHHFMRGYFDGDGCVALSKSKYRPQLHFSVIGTNDFLTEYEKIILNILKRTSGNKWSRCGKAYEINFGGNLQCKKIFDYLYKDATIYLERKRNKFIAVLGED